MGFFQKLKNFGSKIVKGVRKGWEFVRDKIVPVARKFLPYAATAGKLIATATGHPEVAAGIGTGAATANKVMDFISRH